MNAKKGLISTLALLAVGAIAWAGSYYYQNLRGVGPAIFPPKDGIKNSVNETDLPLQIPAGFKIEVFAKDLPGARVMAFDSFENMWVSQTSEGQVSLVEIKDGKAQNHYPVFKNLNKPHGLGFDPENGLMLYIAEEDKISRVPTYSEGSPEKIVDLPTGGGHFTRTIAFSPFDDRLYVSIGSSCNVCEEKDGRRAKIFSMNSDGSDFKEFARGLRNAVFFTWIRVDGKNQMWATEMGRDLLGDDIPPDEINVIEQDGFYGWPWFYGKNVNDLNFQRDVNKVPGFTVRPRESHIDLPAHSAPLGLAFTPNWPESGWPQEYRGNLLVAYHGSWNRSEPTGYKVVRVKIDSRGNSAGIEDFITGWLTEDGRALGRPVDIEIRNDGTAYISDDKAGVIYKLTPLDK